jgi:hypothetical protein
MVMIADLHSRYSHALDTGDASRLAGCFREEADLVVGGVVIATGATVIAERLVSRAPAGILHLVSTATAAADADRRWKSEAYFQLYSSATGQMTAIGRYDDVVEIDADGARYASRGVEYLWRKTDG